MRRDSLGIRSISHLAMRVGEPELLLGELARYIDLHARKVKIPKRGGGSRTVYAASRGLRSVHIKILKRLLQPIDLPPAFHGSVPTKSVVSNAESHVQNKVVATIDIKDFYPSIHPKRVYRLFLYLGCSPDVASLLTKLTTCDGHLPQGFSTSPAIANLVLSKIWPRIAGVGDSLGVNVTVYVDDVAISGGGAVEAATSLIERILSESGLEINTDKSKLMHRHSQQRVTGLVVNDKVNVQKTEYRNIRSQLNRARQQIIHSGGDRPSTNSIRRLRGRIGWVLHINPSRGSGLLSDFQHLSRSDQKIENDQMSTSELEDNTMPRRSGSEFQHTKIGTPRSVTMYTDGASEPNPGRGGYGVVAIEGGSAIELSKGFSLTTNNRMELLAAIEGLEALADRSQVTIVSDSKYLVEGMSKGRAKRWKAMGWLTQSGREVANSDLWGRLLGVADQHAVEFKWVRGHSSDPLNDRADKLSYDAIKGKLLAEDTGYLEALNQRR